MCCALCNELFTGKGSQCEGNDDKAEARDASLHLMPNWKDSILISAHSSILDCRFTSHPKCAEKVFIRCRYADTTEEPDENKLNHRIPHRFEGFTNLSPNWCYHCGHMLTFGRRHKMCTGMQTRDKRQSERRCGGVDRGGWKY
jgi:hypothetical protein